MRQAYEMEYKTKLSHDHASFLMQTGLFVTLIKQENYYLDTADRFFNSQKTMLRIRTTQDKLIFTSKSKRQAGLWEQEFEIDQLDFKHPKIKDFLEAQQVSDPLILIGKAVTYRFNYQDLYGQWSLDFNLFPINSDIELEYEVFDNSLDRYPHFLDQLKKWDIVYDPIVSKYERLLLDINSSINVESK